MFRNLLGYNVATGMGFPKNPLALWITRRAAEYCREGYVPGQAAVLTASPKINFLDKPIRVIKDRRKIPRTDTTQILTVKIFDGKPTLVDSNGLVFTRNPDPTTVPTVIIENPQTRVSNETDA